jgi:hypothetical protein
MVVALFLTAPLNVRALSAADSSSAPAPNLLIEPAAPPIEPASAANNEPAGVRWAGVLNDSLRFLAVEHGFRLLTEPGTRDGMNQVPRGYLNSVGNLHGWSDGDEFYVNYVGHPMQGSVAGFIWTQNDPKYWDVEFGRNRRYWKSRMRAAAFAWAYSVQFEIGPLSEASMGQIQASYPQQGFVDHVVTPAFGLGWMLAEDAIDKYIIKRIEARTNKYVRVFVRGGLNPSRSLANALGGRVPWQRDDRRGLFMETEDDFVRRAGPKHAPESVKVPPLGVAPFEFTMASSVRTFTGPSARGSCLGGGASGSFRIAQAWQLVADVNGCSLTRLQPNVSGDSLSYMIGPRWAPLAAGRWKPYVQVMAGGQRLTHEKTFPAKKRALELIAERKGLPPPEHQEYTQQVETSGFSVAAGAGLDMKLTAAVALRVAGLDYTHSMINSLGGISYRSDMHFASGLVFRFGTW